MAAALLLFASQSHAANPTWDGGGGADTNWSTAANWNPNQVPGDEDTAKFDDTSGNNCTIDINVDVEGIDIKNDYTGTITQGSDFMITVGDKDFKQEGGAFVGGDSAINFNNKFDLKGGTFTSTSDTLFIAKDFKIDGGTFVGGSSAIDVDGKFELKAGTFTSTSGTLSVAKDLKVDGGTFVGGSSAIDVDGKFELKTGTFTSTSGTLSVAKDLKVDGGTFVGGSSAIDVDGKFDLKTGTFTSTSGTLSIAKDFTVEGGTFNHNSGTIQFDGSNDGEVDMGSTTLNHAIIQKGTKKLEVDGTMDVNGDLTITSVKEIKDGTIAVAGNVTTTDTTVIGSGTIKLDGSGAQTLGASGGSGEVPAIEIDKSGGTLVIQDTIEVTGGWTTTAGTVDAGTSTVKFQTNNQTVDSGSMMFNDVDLDLGNKTLTVTGTMDVNGDLTITQAKEINTGTIAVAGNLTSDDSSVAGTGSIKLDGTTAQTLSGSGKDFPNGGLTIDKSSGTASLASDITLDSLLTVAAGTLDHGATFNLTAEDGITLGAGGTYSNTGTGDLTLGGDLTNSGTVTFDAGGNVTDTDDILIRSSANTQRTWSGSGTFSITDVDVSYMKAGTPPGEIIANSSTDSGNNTNWIFQDLLSGKLVITAAAGATSAVAGSNLLLTITARDAGNDVLTHYAGPYSLTWTPSGGSATALVNSSSAGWSGGNTTALVSIGGAQADVGVFKAVDNSVNELTSGNLVFTWYPASFKVQTPASTLKAGEQFTLKVTAKDQDGQTVTRYAGRVNLKLSYENPTSGTEELSERLLLPATFKNGVAGKLVKYMDAGKIKIEAKDTLFVPGKTILGTSGVLNFVPASFEVTLPAIPARMTKLYVNQPFNIQVKALADDGQTVTPNYNGTVTFSADGVTMDTQSHTFVPATDQGQFLFEGLKATTSGKATLHATGNNAAGSSKEPLEFRSGLLIINPASGAPGTLIVSAFIQDIDAEEVVSKDDSTVFTLILENPSYGSIATAKELQLTVSSGTATLEVTKPDAGSVVVSAVVQGFSMPVVSATLKWITGATRSGTGLNILQFEQKKLPLRMRRLSPGMGEIAPVQLPPGFNRMRESFTEGGTRYDAGVSMGYTLVAPPEWVGRQPQDEGEKLSFDFETLLPEEEE